MPVEISLPNFLLLEAGGSQHPFDEYLARRTMRVVITSAGRGYILLNLKKRIAAEELHEARFSVEGLAYMPQAYWYETYVGSAEGAARLLDAARYLCDILTEKEATIPAGFTFGRPMSDEDQMMALSRTF